MTHDDRQTMVVVFCFPRLLQTQLHNLSLLSACVPLHTKNNKRFVTYRNGASLHMSNTNAPNYARCRKLCLHANELIGNCTQRTRDRRAIAANVAIDAATSTAHRRQKATAARMCRVSLPRVCSARVHVTTSPRRRVSGKTRVVVQAWASCALPSAP